MSDTLGNKLKLTIFGASHAPEIGVTISSLPKGMKVDDEFIKFQLAKRRPNGKESTARIEDDEYRIISGVKDGLTTGEDLTLIIPNKKQDSSAYSNIIYRPGHADYTQDAKSNGKADLRGGGHLSGRMTAPIVASCAIIVQYLQSKGIEIGSRIKSIHNVKDDEITNITTSMIKEFNNSSFPTLNKDIELRMKEEIRIAKESLDSVGGEVETYVLNLPVGLGEPFFDSVESEISHAMFSIPAVKGVLFGLGNKFVTSYGSEANDAFRNVDGKIVTLTNNNAGINGGITNGMPVYFNTIIKPTPSISKKQLSVNQKLENVELEIKGRHDPCIVQRACVVIDSLVAFVILDLMLQSEDSLWNMD